MYFSGIADEAGKDLESQIRAHRELGWSHIEMRMVGSTNFTALDETAFETVAERLAEEDLQVSCFSSAIANWARPVSGPFQQDLDDLERAIPRMQRLGTQFIRVMSWPNKGETLLPDEAWRDEAVRRMRELATRAEDGGIVLALENCDGWAAESPANMLEFLERVGSPALRLVFDTGNAPIHRMNSLDLYTQVKRHIAYVHVKDSYVDSDGGEHYTWPNEGHGYVRQILDDLLRSGYDGGISIEPHLVAQIHLGTSVESDDEAGYRSYVEYGKRVQTLVEEIRKTL